MASPFESQGGLPRELVTALNQQVVIPPPPPPQVPQPVLVKFSGRFPGQASGAIAYRVEDSGGVPYASDLAAFTAPHPRYPVPAGVIRNLRVWVAHNTLTVPVTVQIVKNNFANGPGIAISPGQIEVTINDLVTTQDYADGDAFALLLLISAANAGHEIQIGATAEFVPAVIT